ncbi:hypothetical protein [Catenuloplanes indicus]|uniref:Uncharacterized protein n=1 Tax=Catenuloplanes indicus TaxID=137267 RepID=A0AAE3VTB6_9ACTN|nr:hypothetical protein [Catenuloplanes indicus]MDQ0363913.1 hypothetical protein [Catenuloplanes indicus]
MATSPYTLPASTVGHVIGEQSYVCHAGHFCAVAWDPTVSKYEVFDMYYCRNYSVYYWDLVYAIRNC